VEQQLNLLTEARGSFSDLDSVVEQLVYSSLQLAMKTHRFVKGRHNAKTLAFLKACVSYAHITIPSLDSYIVQFRLFALACQVALLNGLVGEAESLFKSAISIVEQLDREDLMVQAEPTLKHLVHLLVFIPENPDSTSGFCILANGCYNACNQLPQEKYKHFKLNTALALLDFTATQMQPKLPFHIFRVDSNDSLMAGSLEYKGDCLALTEVLLTDLIEFISTLQDLKASARVNPTQGDFEAAMRIFFSLKRVFEENTEQVGKLERKIYDLCRTRDPRAAEVKAMEKALS